MKIGIAGGIGSGKSFVCQRIESLGFKVYDCDQAAKRLIQTSADIRTRLTSLIGPATYFDDGTLNKPEVARFLLASAQNAHAVDAIVHPAVFQDFLESGLQWMESALMFESGIWGRLTKDLPSSTKPSATSMLPAALTVWMPLSWPANVRSMPSTTLGATTKS